MKKVVVFLLTLALVGTAFAQHHGNHGNYGGYSGHNNGHRHNGGYNNYRGGGSHHGHGQQHNDRQDFRNFLIGSMVLAGAAVVLNSSRQQPVVVEETMVSPTTCQFVQQRVVDAWGRPLFDQYSGRPMVRQVQVCTTQVVRY